MRVEPEYTDEKDPNELFTSANDDNDDADNEQVERHHRSIMYLVLSALSVVCINIACH